MMAAARLRLALLLYVFMCAAWARPGLEPAIRLPSERAAAAGEGTDDAVGTRWAVLIAGSNGYYNYRHQVRAPTPTRRCAPRAPIVGSAARNLISLVTI